ncbi:MULTISPECIES: HAD family hydrolase [unclassified Prevotella]|uniref:HAD family hydrolase n=1 Tax=unclassified Prevotella TaxID=2638335 RepID=UPI00117F9215|nr:MULTISPECIES: HAD family hydrolase [unclassified Prevotella]
MNKLQHILMLIFLDLDGTLVNTVHPSWKPYKDGLQDFLVAQIPLFAGVKEFIASRKHKGDSLVIASDSHPRYVNPIADMLSVEALSLADKPNNKKILEFLDSHPQYKQMVAEGNCLMVGDTKLDIEFGRRIGALTCWIHPYRITKDIIDERDGIGDEMASKKMEPTFTVKNFAAIEEIIDFPLNNLTSVS